MAVREVAALTLRQGRRGLLGWVLAIVYPEYLVSVPADVSHK